MFQFSTTPPLALYVHLPWCTRKCPYCDFNSHGARDEIAEQAYIDALLADLETELPLVWGRAVSSIFIGGGTPSLFSATAIERLLAGIRARLRLRGDIEISMEANPGSAEQTRFAAYRQAGVNRLSLGIQSFNDRHLQALGRVHDAEQARSAIKAARDAGFTNLNLDLMYGLPGQGVDEALNDLKLAIAYRPEHISHYQLTIEPDTAFAKQPPSLPGDDERWHMQQACSPHLEKAGYRQYEVSAYAQDGKRCRHNLNYWTFGDYIGIGAGAHGKITLASEQRIERRSKLKQPQRYMEATADRGFLDEQRCLSADDALFEFMLNGLRLRDGVDLDTFIHHSGLHPDYASSKIKHARQQGLLTLDERRLQATPLGQRFLNDLVELFLPEQVAA